MKAWMDGTNSVPITSGLWWPRSIAVDYNSSTLYWTTNGPDRVRSIRLDETNPATLVEEKNVYGISVGENRIYFSTYSKPSVLKSCNKLEGT